MGFYLAVDAGGTKTDYVLADETRELARVRSGTIKRMRADESTATANLEQAITEIERKSGVNMSAVKRTCVGTAGETVPLVTDWLRKAFGARVGGELLIVGDVEIALDAAFHGGGGVLVLAGTGSNVAGRSEAGEITTAGGWGPALAEQGSGYRIGTEALRAAFMSLDEGRTTLLLEAILQHWGLNAVSDLVAYANQLPAPDFADLTVLVLQCALQGDETARAVLQQQGEELAHLACLVIARLQRMNTPEWKPAIAFAGSIMQHIAPVRDAAVAAVKMKFPQVLAMDGVVDPISGAVWRARQA